MSDVVGSQWLPSRQAAQIAQMMARNGLAVFPVHSVGTSGCSCGKKNCQHPGKHPRTARGFKEATTLEQQIDQWWAQYRSANIGLATGECSGVFVLDVDPRNGGDDSLEELIAEHGQLPETLTVETGGGGMHYYFQYPGFAVKCGSGVLGAGLDIKGEGGYVIAPPSSHASGGQYSIVSGDFDRAKIAVAPEWLLKLLQASSLKSSAHVGGRFSANGSLASVSGGEELVPEGQRNSRLVRVAGAMRRQGMGFEEMLPRLLDYNETHCHPPLDQKEVESICRSVERYEPEPSVDASGKVILDPADPLGTARKFIAAMFMVDDFEAFHCIQGDFYIWNGTCYTTLPLAGLRSQLYGWLSECIYTKDEKLHPFKPTKKKLDDVIDAMKGEAYRDVELGQATWLIDDPEVPPAHTLIPMANGLLDYTNNTMLDPTPTYFNTWSIDFNYEDEPAVPAKWLTFLHQVFSNDNQAIAMLQEWFGYCLTPDTSRQKILLMVGPPRSGKGTIAHILTQLLGKENIAGPSLNSMTTEFGLAPLIGKSLAIVADARLAGKGHGPIVERLLSISGEDTQTVNRKYREPWTGRLSARLMIASNELPSFDDSSTALASRFITLRMRQSFLGRENLNLKSDLEQELPGIMKWALEGLQRLSERGFFIQPESSASTARLMRDAQSPLSEFIEECCEIGDECTVETKVLYSAVCNWCDGQNIPRYTAQIVGKNMHDLIRGLTTVDSKPRRYKGVKLKDSVLAQPPEEMVNRGNGFTPVELN